MSKRWDSSSRASLDKEMLNDNNNIGSSDRALASITPEEEIIILKKRNNQLSAENERLKASVFLLTEKLSKKKDVIFSMDPLISAMTSSVPTPSPNLTLNNKNNPGLSTVEVPMLVQKHPSKEFTDDDSEDGGLITGESTVCKTTLTGHTSAVYACKYSPDGLNLVSTSLDTSVRLWELSNNVNTVLGYHSQSGTDLVWDGSQVASSSLDMTVKLWDTTKINPEIPVSSFSTHGVALCLSMLDSFTVVSGTSLGFIHQFDIRSGKNELNVTATPQTDCAINALCFDEPRYLLSGDAKGRIKVWDLRITRGEELYCIEGHRAISGFAYGSNGYLAVNSYDNALRVFSKHSTEGIRLIHTLRGHRSKNWPIRSSFSRAISNQPLMLATGSTTNSCFLFGMLPALPNSEELLQPVSLIQQLQGHTGSVYSCDFSIDNHLATASQDSTIKIWRKKSNLQ